MSQEKGFTEFVDYQYSSNQNIVLQAKRRARGNEPTGEVENLAPEKLFKMGDLAKHRKPPTRRKKISNAPTIVVRSKRSVLNANIHTAQSDLYTPKSEENRLVWENFLSFITNYLGSVDSSTISEVSNEVLKVLKDETLTDKEKLPLVRGILDGIDDDGFMDLIRLSKRISDYYGEEKDVMDVDNDYDESESGMALVFEQEEDLQFVDTIIENDDDDDDEGVETTQGEEIGISENSQMIPIENIVPDFLLNYLKEKEIYKDKLVEKKNADEAWEVLRNPNNTDAVCENELAPIFDFQMEAVTPLLINRWRIVFTILFNNAKQSKNSTECSKVIEEMKSRGGFSKLITKLTGKDDMEVDKERSTKKVFGKKVDIEMYQFDGGSHLMTNKTCSLPKTTRRTKMKGYEEVHIPPPEKMVLSKEELVPTSKLPTWAKTTFPFTHFNPMQTKVFDCALKDEKNLLVCAPTGAGKTVVALLTILQEIGKNVETNERGEFVKLNPKFKIIYIAPMKALVQEVVGKFSGTLGKYGVKVGELTGDSTLTRAALEETNVIVATPEKWDVVTRKSEDRSFVDDVRLIIIDEIHLLHDDRGPVLESIISRTIRHQALNSITCRIVGISATLPNYMDVGMFLRCPHENIYRFGNEYRPVPLDQHYIGVSEKKNYKRRKLMNDICYQKVIERDDQIIIFVHSRKETRLTAQFIRDKAESEGKLGRFLKDQSGSKVVLEEVSTEIQNESLKELLKVGIGIHNAGMVREDRRLVEDLFEDKHIKILVSTATLAWGVNLPAHTVIIKGTKIYNPEHSQWEELSSLDIMQMVGRAGRPDFDESGEGILITTDTELLFYLSLFNNQLPIESQMMKKIVDNLNAEIQLGSVNDFSQATDWFKCTYLYVRMYRNRKLYSVQNENIDDEIRNIIHSAALELHKNGLISYSKRSGSFQALDLGRVASHYYIPFDCVNLYQNTLKPHLSLIDILDLFSLSNEFKYIIIRMDERAELSKLSKIIPIPLKVDTNNNRSKINILLQCFISRIKLRSFSLLSDLSYIKSSGTRIIRAMMEIALIKNYSGVALKLLELSKMITSRQWNNQTPLRQFGVSEKVLRTVEKRDLDITELTDLNVPQLNELFGNKNGRLIYRLCHRVPKLEISISVVPVGHEFIKFDVIINSDFEWDKVHGGSQMFHLFVSDCDNKRIIHYQKFLVNRRYVESDGGSMEFNFMVKFSSDRLKKNPVVFFDVVSDKFLGSWKKLPVLLTDLKIPSLKSHNVFTTRESVGVKIGEEFGDVEKKMIMMNKLSLNESVGSCYNEICYGSDNLFFGVTSFLDKVSIIELLIFQKMFLSQNNKKINFVVTNRRTLKYLKTKWKKTHEKNIYILSGDEQEDIKQILPKVGNSVYRIVLGTYDDLYSFLKKENMVNFVKAVGTICFDDIHKIEHNFSVVEFVVSQVCFLNKFINQEKEDSEKSDAARIVTLGNHTMYPADICKWIGAKKYFNYKPSDVLIEKLGSNSYRSKFSTIVRKIYLSVFKSGESKEREGKKILVLLQTQTDVIKLLNELLTYSQMHLKRVAKEIKEGESIFEDDLLSYSSLFNLFYMTVDLSVNDVQNVLRSFYIGESKGGSGNLIVVSTYYAFNETIWSSGKQSYENIHNLLFDESIIVNMDENLKNSPFQDSNEMDSSFIYSVANFSKKVKIITSSTLTHSVQFEMDGFLESSLDQNFVQWVLINTGRGLLKNMQNALDFISTSTYFFQRLKRNPNFYNLANTSEVSSFLSELVEGSFEELHGSGCSKIVHENEDDTVGTIVLTPVGDIAYEMNVQYSTVDLYTSSLISNLGIRGIIEILAASSEFDLFFVKSFREEKILKKLIQYAPLKVVTKDGKRLETLTKVNLLFQAHFSRLKRNMVDKLHVMWISKRLVETILQIMLIKNFPVTDLISGLELSQMITQKIWDNDSTLKQIPGFEKDIISKIGREEKIENVFDLLESDNLEKILKNNITNPVERKKTVMWLNNYPNIEIDFEKKGDEVKVWFESDSEEQRVYSFRKFFCSWWLFICDGKKIVKVKKMRFESKKLEMGFKMEHDDGKKVYTLYFLCDSYSGCDQEYKIE